MHRFLLKMVYLCTFEFGGKNTAVKKGENIANLTLWHLNAENSGFYPESWFLRVKNHKIILYA